MITKKHIFKVVLFCLALVVIFSADSFGQGFGIDASSPNTKLDVNGDLALRIGSYTASNGNNNNISIGTYSFIRITGPSAGYTITGISGGVNGKMLILFNNTAYDMTIANQNSGSSAVNRNICSDSADALVKKYGCATLIYSSTDSRWIVTSTYKP